MQLGSLLEELTVAKARAGIEKLVHLTPQKARLITAQNEQIVPAEAVKVGDLLRVFPGETIPVDGVIISGHTSVNQAVMTGESLPVDKAPGDEVSSGTVNQFGAFDMRAAKVGEDSSIQRIIRLVQSADAGKAKIVGIADRWATWIVVIALTSAALTWFFTGEIIRAVTILVVFCPCALVLATPTAIMAAIGNATKHGFLVREGDALERLAAVTKITFDNDAKVGDTWIVGAAFGYTDNSTDFSNGSADSDGYTFSVYGTAVLPTGSYLDLIGRVGRISTDIDVSTVTPFKASYDNTTVGLSAEVGHRFDLSQIFYVTPQAELAYGRVFGDDYSGSNGMKVSQDDFDTLIARIGFQAGANFADNRGSIYLTASVNHDFLGDTEATASKAGAQDQKLKEDLGGTWFSYGIGAQFSTTNNLSFYGSLTRANGSDYQEDYHYSVGARYVF